MLYLINGCCFFHWWGHFSYTIKFQVYFDFSCIYLFSCINFSLLIDLFLFIICSIIPLFFLKILLFQINVLFMLMCHFVKKSINIGLLLVFLSTVCQQSPQYSKLNTHRASSEQCYMKQSESYANFLQENTDSSELFLCFGGRSAPVYRPRDASGLACAEIGLFRARPLLLIVWAAPRLNTLSPCFQTDEKGLGGARLSLHSFFYLQLNAFQMEQLYRKQFR